MAQFPSTTSASDVWSLTDVYRAEAGGNWPSGILSKFYFEFDYYAADSNGGWGFTTNSTLSATHPSQQGTNFVGFRSDGNAGSNGTGFFYDSSLSTYTGGPTRFGIAIDYTTGRFWVRQGSSSWSFGDPVAGTSWQGTIPAGDANTKLFYTAYNGDYLFSRAVADFSYSTPTGYVAQRTNTFYVGYDLGSTTYSESNYKNQNNGSNTYGGAYILMPTTI